MTVSSASPHEQLSNLNIFYCRTIEALKEDVLNIDNSCTQSKIEREDAYDSHA